MAAEAAAFYLKAIEMSPGMIAARYGLGRALIDLERPDDAMAVLKVVVDADPPIDCVIHGGVHGDLATSAIACNAIGRLLAAPPGLHTMATIPSVVHAPARG